MKLFTISLLVASILLLITHASIAQQPIQCEGGFANVNATTCAPVCFGLLATDVNVCSQHGTCVSPNVCACNGTWKGSICNMECEQGFQKDSNGTCAPLCYGIITTSSTVCSGNGICSAPDTCNCFTNFTGSTCSKKKIVVTVNGTEVSSVLACYGIEATDANVCSQHGVCVSPDKCNCTEPWLGALCNMECESGFVKSDNGSCVMACFGIASTDANVCSGRGTCLGVNNCNCSSEFRGQQCESIKPPECNSTDNTGACENICFGLAASDINVCSRSGACIAPNKCNCTWPWFGDICNQCPEGYSPFNNTCIPTCFGATSVATDIVCSGNGQCISPNKCNCTNANFTGEQCDVNIGKTNETNNNCTLITGVAGFTGPNCTIPICFGVLANETTVCSNGQGACIAPNTCNCTEGFTGENCQNATAPLCEPGFAPAPLIANVTAESTNSSAANCVPVCFNISSAVTAASINSTSSDLLPCHGHGSCVAPDTCVCENGFFGPACNILMCFGKMSNDSLVCNGRGNCSATDTCTCNSTMGMGTECETPICFGIAAFENSVCSNGKGVCVAPDTCQCALGWSGIYCNETQCWDIPSTSNATCSGHGQCVAPHECVCQHVTAVSSVNDSSVSQVQALWAGKACEIPVCFGIAANESATVCSGRGSCDAPNNCTCFNSTRFTGLNCDIRIAPNCTEGFGGEECELAICFGILANNTQFVCNGVGTCGAPNTCNCTKGWTGLNCSIPMCFGVNSTIDETTGVAPVICSGHGSCHSADNCSCVAGYIGEQCETVNCTTGYTLSLNSTATQFWCVPVCFNFSSENVTLACSSQQRGICVAPDQCECNLGFSGVECQVTENVCFGVVASNTTFVCNGKGVCNGTNACQCQAGFSGAQCELGIPSCNGTLATDPTVCSGRGICNSTDNCTCTTAGFTGLNCESPLCGQGFQLATNGSNVCEPLCFTIPASNSAAVCSGRGSCVGVDLCDCTGSGFSGTQCEIPAPATSSPVTPATSSPVTVCPTGFTNAPKCDVPLCFGIAATSVASVCSGHGSCIAPNSCNCTRVNNVAAFTGAQCEIPVAPQQPNDTLTIICNGKNSSENGVCSNKGQCVYLAANVTTGIVNGTCNCTAGYSGTDCSLLTCFNVLSSSQTVCSGNGVCSGPNTCTCRSGFKGTQCSEKSNSASQAMVNVWASVAGLILTLVFAMAF